MKINAKILFSVILFFVILSSCEKDRFTEKEIINEQTIFQNSHPTITIGDAKRAYEAKFSDIMRDEGNLAEPVWEAAINSNYADALDIIITPIDPREMNADIPGAMVNVVSYTNTSGEVNFFYLASIPEQGYLAANNYRAQVSNFTGIFAAVGPDGTVFDPIIIRDGAVDEVIPTTALEQEVTCWPPWWPDWLTPNGCPSPSGGGAAGYSDWQKFINKLGNWFSDFFNNSDNTNPVTTDPPENELTFLSYIWNLNIDDFVPINIGTPEGGGGVLFNEDLLTGEDRIIASEINEFKIQLNLWQSSQQILYLINQSCASVEDFAAYITTDENGYPSLNSLFYKIHLHAQTACVAEVIMQDRIYAFEEMGITVTEEQLVEIVGEDCIYGPDFANCSLNGAITWIGTTLGLLPEEIEALSQDINIPIIPTLISALIDDDSPEVQSAVNSIVDLLEQHSGLELTTEEIEWLLEKKTVLSQIMTIIPPNVNIDWRPSHLSMTSNTVAFLTPDGKMYIYDKESGEEIGVFEDFDISEDQGTPNIPFSSGWLSCNSFDFALTPPPIILYACGVDNLSFSVTYGPTGQTQTITFSIDVRINMFGNADPGNPNNAGILIDADDANKCTSWAANIAAKLLQFRIAEYGGMSPQGIKEDFVMFMDAALNSNSFIEVPAPGFCDNIEGSVLLGNNIVHRNSATYYSNFPLYWINCY